MYNKIFIIGNLTRDPEVRSTPTGVTVAKFTVAVARPGKPGGKSGVGGEGNASSGPEADFIPVVAWRRLAEICGEFLKKGKQVAVEGRIQARSFEKDGERRIFTEIVADNLQMLGRRSDGASGSASTTTTSGAVAEIPELVPEEAPF